MISLVDIHISMGRTSVLKGVNLQVQEKECIAVVGPNGCGKSTLLRLIKGDLTPDRGKVNLPGKITVGYLPQEEGLNIERSLEEELTSAFTEILKAHVEMKELEHQMATLSPDSPEYEQILPRYADASHFVEHHDGYNLDVKVRQVAAGLGFSEQDMQRPCREFAGGWQMRILLAKILLRKPDVLLLDEPTNHLDLETILWLEDWIRNCDRTVIMVSHERAFMDRLVDRIVCLENGTADVYHGGYSHYIEQSAQKREAFWKAYLQREKEIAAIEAFIRRFRANKERARMVQSRIKMLAKMERLERPFHPTAIHFEFPPAPHSHTEVITLENLGHRYDNHKVFSDITLTIRRGEKIGLVGINGAGKSTLLRILVGRVTPSEGSVTIGGKVNIEYFAQYDAMSHHSDQSLLALIQARAPLGEAQKSRNLLGAFLFTGDDVEKPLNVLSGGERTRFRLAQMLFSDANLLLLDEPTNHLDVTSRTTVEEAIRKFNGTVIVVSHDRVFMNRVTNRILELEHGHLRNYPGKYDDYLRYKQKMLNEKSDIPERVTEKESTEKVSKRDRIRLREERKMRERTIRKLERHIGTLEREIASQEKRLRALKSEMENPVIATDHTRIMPLVEEQEILLTDHKHTLELWTELQEKLDALKQGEHYVP